MHRWSLFERAHVYRMQVVLALFALLVCAIVAPGHALAADPYEPNESVGSAASLTFPVDTYAELGILGRQDTDWYKIHLEPGCYRFTVSWTGSSRIDDMDLLSSAGVSLATGSNFTAVDDHSEFLYSVSQADDYYLQVGDPSWRDPTVYRLVINSTFDNLEPNNTRASAKLITETGVLTSFLSTPNDVDYYKMYLSEGAVVHVFAERPLGEGAGLRLQMFDGVDGAPIYEDHQDVPNMGVGAVFRVNVEGYYYVGLQNYPIDEGSSEQSAYILTVTGDLTVKPPPSLTRPKAVPSRPKRRKTTTIVSYVTPVTAALVGTSKVSLYHRETKTVRRRVHGRLRKVKVKYWRLRATRPMTAGSGGRVSAKYKFPYSGQWRMVVNHSGGTGYSPSSSPAALLTVK